MNKKGKRERKKNGKSDPSSLYYLRQTQIEEGVEDVWKDFTKGRESRGTNGKRIGKLVEIRGIDRGEKSAENEN